jgi:hypothetical protein
MFAVEGGGLKLQQEARDVLIGNGRPGAEGGEGEGTTSQAVSCGERGEGGGG